MEDMKRQLSAYLCSIYPQAARDLLSICGKLFNNLCIFPFLHYSFSAHRHAYALSDLKVGFL